MNTAVLLQLARPPGAVASSTEALAHVPAGAAETLLWLQPPADDAQLARADLARDGRFEALGEVHAMGSAPLWRANPSARPLWLAAIHQLPMLLDLAQAWVVRRESADLAAWARIARSWLAVMGTGELAGGDAQVEAKRIEHCVTALLLLRRGGGLRQLPPRLVLCLVDRLAGEAEYLLSRLNQAGRQRSSQLYAAYLATGLLGPCLAARSRARAWAHAAQVRELLAASVLADFGADGVHGQGAAQLHRPALLMALSFVALARALDHPLPQALHRRLRAALEFSLWTTLPDGAVALANDGEAASNRPLLATGAALYLLPHLDHVATGGRRGEAPEGLGRHFAQAGYVALRDGWHDEAGAQHLFCDCPVLGAGSRSGEERFSLSYSIAGHQVLVDTGGDTVTIDGRTPARQGAAPRRSGRRGAPWQTPAVELPPALVRLGTRSALLRAGAPTDPRQPAHTRCLAYVMRQYVLLVDRVQAGDGARHEACFTLQFAADWQDRIVAEEDGGRAAVLRGVSQHASSDWRLLLDVPAAHLHLGSEWLPRRNGRRQPAPCLRATQEFRAEAFFACAIAPQASGCAVHALAARHGAGRSVLTVTGESAGRPFVDRLVVHWQEPGLVIRPDYHGRAGLALERRVDGVLEHLMLAEAGEWFSRLRPVHAGRMADAAGDLEW
jgi:hypothetical protein